MTGTGATVDVFAAEARRQTVAAKADLVDLNPGGLIFEKPRRLDDLMN